MVYALTFLVSMGVAALCVLCMRRFQLNWMGSFIMSISLIASMAASSIVTTVIVALGVLLLLPLQPVLESKPVRIAGSYMLPALYG